MSNSTSKTNYWIAKQTSNLFIESNQSQPQALLHAMMTDTDNEQLLESACSEADKKPRLALWYKIVFFVIGLISALTICLLIRLSNKLTAEAEHKALLRFKEMSDQKTGQFKF